MVSAWLHTSSARREPRESERKREENNEKEREKKEEVGGKKRERNIDLPLDPSELLINLLVGRERRIRWQAMRARADSH